MQEKISKYQIFEKPEDSNFTAGGKAVEDVRIIAKKVGFQELQIPVIQGNNLRNKIRKQYAFYKAWNKIYSEIPQDAILLFQYPSYEKQPTRTAILKKLKNNKNVKFIFVIHDVNSLRESGNSKFYLKFNDMIELADKIIVHNRKMKDYFIKLGVSNKKLIDLKIFDYLINNYKYCKSNFSKTVNIAGNLSKNKSRYLEYLGKVKVAFQLYGPNYDLVSKPNIKYEGLFSPEKLTSVLNKGFGLVWDGDSIDSCDGAFGKYLKYNNPHKLSLYIASNLPVIIWRNAAEAEFVSQNNIGFVIDSLNELPQIFEQLTQEQYDQYCENIKKVATNIVQGSYMSRALNVSINDIMSE